MSISELPPSHLVQSHLPCSCQKSPVVGKGTACPLLSVLCCLCRWWMAGRMCAGGGCLLWHLLTLREESWQQSHPLVSAASLAHADKSCLFTSVWSGSPRPDAVGALPPRDFWELRKHTIGSTLFVLTLRCVECPSEREAVDSPLTCLGPWSLGPFIGYTGLAWLS